MKPNLQPVFRVRCVRCHKETLSHGGPANRCYFCGGRVTPTAGVQAAPKPSTGAASSPINEAQQAAPIAGVRVPQDGQP